MNINNQIKIIGINIFGVAETRYEIPKFIEPLKVSLIFSFLSVRRSPII
ncbi:hypothetical protein [Dapis sp. BLCC M172]